MYISTNGYAVLINTARYTTFYCGTLNPKEDAHSKTTENNKTALSTDELYANQSPVNGAVVADIPIAKGIEIFVFSGPDMINAIQRYNLFSGGGCLPALWGLGVKYRVKGDSKDTDVYKTARYFREHQIPCDVIGLEPRWQTAAYSCSYVWNDETFPEPQHLIDSLQKQDFKINLWEHAFVHPSSPIHDDLLELSGDYRVWNGLVPDFSLNKTREIFGGYHNNTFVLKGIAGFKLDECDNSNLSEGSATWSFPEVSQFPSGMDGEQMHQMFGLLYARVFNDIYKKNNKRTYLDYRASGPFASSLPASLYSDTYNHSEYIRMISNSGFGGLLWSPELRESNSDTELIRRIQTAVLSAQTLINSWYLSNPPWLQYNKDKNNRYEFLKNAKELEDLARIQLNFRMSLISYLYTAFVRYHLKGIPPFRALVLDYPHDEKVLDVWNEYMIGENILATPLTGDSDTRTVYLPEGIWYNYNNNQKYEGGKSYQVSFSLAEIPVFIKAGSILPMATPVQSVSENTRFEITCKVYGKSNSEFTLYEDDGISYDFDNGKYNTVFLSWKNLKGKVSRSGKYNKRYLIKKWELIE
ncbi:TIM-barrel domain-containing protein [Carboxylicivirga caseinilyticus]|uniref:glycoside hydrolase family 31 protein n=1 Tax=Carboxylicivirga caseinilyticus TaxID=3417572 RepID=UPI003D3508F3|nr:DUF5110 domain-containing protein [Marinilabiliaceae bacterium A049]